MRGFRIIAMNSSGVAAIDKGMNDISKKQWKTFTECYDLDYDRTLGIVSIILKDELPQTLKFGFMKFPLSKSVIEVQLRENLEKIKIDFEKRLIENGAKIGDFEICEV